MSCPIQESGEIEIIVNDKFEGILQFDFDMNKKKLMKKDVVNAIEKVCNDLKKELLDRIFYLKDDVEFDG
jgi:hypothetical protein